MMDVEYTGRHTTITKKLKTQAEAGLASIEKILGKGTAHVILTPDKFRQKAEVTVQTKHHSLVATCEATEMTVALHDALAKIEQQAIRHQQRARTIKRNSKSAVKGAVSEAVEEMTPRVAAKKTAAVKVATKSSVGRKAVPMVVHSFPSKAPITEPHVVRSADGVALRPMSLEEAVKECEMRDRDVFVFRDHTGLAMVLHRKKNGKMELIEVP